MYAPTLTNPSDVKDAFYSVLKTTIISMATSDKLLLLGDFNAQVGREFTVWPGVIGCQGVSNSNSNRLLLLLICTEFKLCITNTVFRLPDKLTCTWMHPQSKSWHLINYVITQQRDISDIRITRIKFGAMCSMDHQMVWSKLCLSIKPPCRLNMAKPPQKLNTTKLKSC